MVVFENIDKVDEIVWRLIQYKGGYCDCSQVC